MFWMPHLSVTKLWKVDGRELFTDGSLVALKRCSGDLVLRGTFTMDIKCDFNFGRFPFDRQVCRAHVCRHQMRSRETIFAHSCVCCLLAP